jgi:hypothetical protein
MFILRIAIASDLTATDDTAICISLDNSTIPSGFHRMKIKQLAGAGSPLLAALLVAPQIAHAYFEDLCASTQTHKIVACVEPAAISTDARQCEECTGHQQMF